MVQKLFIKMLLAKVVTKTDTTIVIASSGRQGSTVLFHAVRNCIARNQIRGISRLLPVKMRRRLITGYPWAPKDFNVQLPPICKTHVPINLIPGTKRTKDKMLVLFIFGDPKDSAYSAFHENLSKGSLWIKRHQEHLMGQGDASNIFNEDILNFDGQMTAAKERLEKENDSTMLVHYLDLWDELPRIRKFLGLDISLPKFRARQKGADYSSIDWGEDFEMLQKRAETLRSGA